MEGWLMHFLSILTYIAVCFSACLFPALCLHRVQRSRIWHEIICNLNCLSGGVFAATFFILYNHVRHDFEELFRKKNCAWHSVFALDTVIVFCGFLLTALVEKFADYVQHRLASTCDKGTEKSNHQANTEKTPVKVSDSPNDRHHSDHTKPYAEEMSPLTADGCRNSVYQRSTMPESPSSGRSPGRALPTLTVLNCNGASIPLKTASPTGDLTAVSPGDIKCSLRTNGNNKSNSLRRSGSAPTFDTERNGIAMHATTSSAADVHNLDDQDPHNCGHTHHHHHQHHHVPEDLPGSGTKRFIVIIVSLSAHSLFEGMALGVQQTKDSLLFLKLFLTILLHEALMALAIGLSISQQNTLSAFRKMLFCLLFAVIVPAGQLIGVIMRVSTGSNDGRTAEDHGHDHDSCHSHAEHGGQPSIFGAVVQAIAAGTFLFVTFMEILSERLNCHEFSIVRSAFILAGFLIIPAVTMVHHQFVQVDNEH